MKLQINFGETLLFSQQKKSDDRAIKFLSRHHLGERASKNTYFGLIVLEIKILVPLCFVTTFYDHMMFISWNELVN